MLQGESMDDQVDAALDRLLVEFGKEILRIIPGKVSTEVDARFSFDTKCSVNKALHFIDVRQKPGPTLIHYYNADVSVAIQIRWDL